MKERISRRPEKRKGGARSARAEEKFAQGWFCSQGRDGSPSGPTFAWKGGTGVPPVNVANLGTSSKPTQLHRSTRPGRPCPILKQQGRLQPMRLATPALASRRESGTPAASRLVTYASESEASLPIPFKGRCRAAGTFGVYGPFFFPSRHTLFPSSVFSVSSVVQGQCPVM